MQFPDSTTSATRERSLTAACLELLSIICTLYFLKTVA